MKQLDEVFCVISKETGERVSKIYSKRYPAMKFNEVRDWDKWRTTGEVEFIQDPECEVKVFSLVPKEEITKLRDAKVVVDVITPSGCTFSHGGVNWKESTETLSGDVEITFSKFMNARQGAKQFILKGTINEDQGTKVF